MTGIRAVVFDLDGTLLDRKSAFETYMLEQAERFAARLGDVTRERFIDAAFRTDLNGTAPRTAAFQQMAAELGLDERLATELVADYKVGFPATCRLFPGAMETLRSLRADGLRLGLITNGSVSMQSRKLDAVDLRPVLDAILISEGEGVRKPDAAIFHRAAERLGVESSVCVFVGDNPEADVRGAKRVGMRAVWVRDPWWNDQPEEADAVIGHIRELVPVVETWRG
jgi:putative hydrolase of the HAD superfamily